MLTYLTSCMKNVLYDFSLYWLAHMHLENRCANFMSCCILKLHMLTRESQALGFSDVFIKTRYPITPHMSTWAYSKIFSFQKSDGYEHMCLCPNIMIKSILETCYSSTSRQNKTKVCKLNLWYLINLNKFGSGIVIWHTSQRQKS